SAAEPQTAVAPAPPDDRPRAEGELRTWRIHFRPAPDLLLKGTNPLMLFGELSRLGELRVEAIDESIPDFRQLDPEQCFLRWTLELETSSPRESIADVFVFVEDTCEISIESVGPNEAPVEPAPCAPLVHPAGPDTPPTDAASVLTKQAERKEA